MKPWQIVLLVIGIIFVVYFLSSLVYLRIMRNFIKRINHRLDAIDVLLAQKYEVLRLVGKLFKKYKVVLPAEFEEELAPHFDERLKEVTGTERTTIRSYLLKATQAVLFFGEQNKKLAADSEYISLKKPLVEVDDDYRKAVANYNADVLGYNYWIRVLPWRWVAKLSHFHSKDVIA
jgi:hypothetical protein